MKKRYGLGNPNSNARNTSMAIQPTTEALIMNRRSLGPEVFRMEQ